MEAVCAVVIAHTQTTVHGVLSAETNFFTCLSHPSFAAVAALGDGKLCVTDAPMVTVLWTVRRFTAYSSPTLRTCARSHDSCG